MITQEDLDFLKVQKPFHEKGNLEKEDYEIHKNPIFEKIFNKTLEEINKNPLDVSFINVQLKKVKDKQNIFNSQREVLQLYATRQEDEASEEVSELIKNQNVFHSTKDDLKSEIWVYQEGIFIPNGETEIKRLCRLILGKAYTPQRVNKVVEKIRADTFIESEKFFSLSADIGDIPVQNGILNIKTKKLSPFTPKKIFFAKLPVKYDINARCPSIEKFFKEILKDESDSKVMFELLGYSLLREYTFEKAFMFLGYGRNGKGKTLSLFRKFLGIENCCSVPLSQMKHESSALCELHNKLANLSGDLNNTDLKETGVFKMITGRDLIQARRKFLRDLIFVNHAKMIFACNELPRVYDLSEGFWSRWILLEFPYKFVSQEEFNKTLDKTNLKIEDPKIIEKIATPEELSGLLNSSLEALERLQRQKSFSVTKGTAEVKDLWIRKSDSFTAFCWDFLEEDPEQFISKKELRKRFSQYCKKFKIKGTSDKAIKVTLEDLFGVIESRKDVGGSFETTWEGIKFKGNYKDYNGFPKSLGNGGLHIDPNTLETLVIDDNFSKKELKEAGHDDKIIEEVIK